MLAGDTTMHSWEVLAKILQDPQCFGIVLDLGMSATNLSVKRRAILTNLARQACRAQECAIQLPHHRLRRQDPAHPTQDVDGQRRQLSRAEMVRALDEASRDGRALFASHDQVADWPGMLLLP